MFSLEAKIRTEVAKIARVDGVIPAVVYGKDTPSTMLTVATSEFIKVYRESGKNHVITLSVGKTKYSVLVTEAQRHPVTGLFLHLDFLVVDMKAQAHVQIAIRLIGTSPALLEGGQMHQSLETLDVKCLPADIVDGFDLDVSTLARGHSLHVSDIKLDTKKYQVLAHAEESVVSMHAPKKQKDEDTTASVADVAVATAKPTAA